MAREYEKRREAMGQRSRAMKPEVISEDVIEVDDSVTPEQIAEVIEKAEELTEKEEIEKVLDDAKPKKRSRKRKSQADEK